MKIDIEKIHQAILDMMSKVEFQEFDETGKKIHRYTEKATGKYLAGVSSISSIFPKPYLVPWAAKEAVKYLGYEDDEIAYKTIQKIKKIETIKEYQELLHKAKTAHKKKSGKAMIDGTKGHKVLEAFVLAKIRGTKLPKLPTGMLRRPVQQFIEWQDKNIKQWLLSEALVCSVRNSYAGTLDGLAITTANKLAVIDFKFAKQIGDDYFLQVAGYSLPFEEYGIKIEDRIIVRLPKTLTKEVWNKYTHQYETKENNIEIARSPFSYKFDSETFENARVIFKYINACAKKK